MGHRLTLTVSPPLAAFPVGGQLPVRQEVCPLHQVCELPPDFSRKAHPPGVQAHVAAPLGRKMVPLPALRITEDSLSHVPSSTQMTPLLIRLLRASWPLQLRHIPRVHVPALNWQGVVALGFLHEYGLDLQIAPDDGGGFCMRHSAILSRTVPQAEISARPMMPPLALKTARGLLSDILSRN